MTVGAVILAAGASSRLGRPKQILDGPRGTLVQATINAARAASAEPVLVAIGADADRVRPHCAEALLVDVPNWAQGQHASLVAGLSTLQRTSPHLDAAFLLVCDQPALDADVLIRVEDAFRRTGADAAAAWYNGAAGVPALVSHRLFDRLMASPSDGGAGAREVLRDPAVRTALVEWPDGAFDIDTPADAAKLAAMVATRLTTPRAAGA